MDDYLFKMGMVAVGAIVIVLLISFAMNALKKTGINDGFEQSYSGSAINSAQRIRELCSLCTASGAEKDCYMLNLTVPDPITQSRFDSVKITLSATIPEGSSLLRIKTRNSECMIDVI